MPRLYEHLPLQHVSLSVSTVLLYALAQHTSIVDSPLNSTMQLISGTPRPTPLPYLPVLASMEPPAFEGRLQQTDWSIRSWLVRAGQSIFLFYPFAYLQAPTSMSDIQKATVAAKWTDIERFWREREREREREMLLTFVHYCPVNSSVSSCHLCVVLVVQACHLDPMLDDSVMFARRLRHIRNPVRLEFIADLPHGFLNFVLVSHEAKSASDRCVAALRSLLSTDKFACFAVWVIVLLTPEPNFLDAFDGN